MRAGPLEEQVSETVEVDPVDAVDAGIDLHTSAKFSATSVISPGCNLACRPAMVGEVCSRSPSLRGDLHDDDPAKAPGGTWSSTRSPRACGPPSGRAPRNWCREEEDRLLVRHVAPSPRRCRARSTRSSEKTARPPDAEARATPERRHLACRRLAEGRRTRAREQSVPILATTAAISATYGWLVRVLCGKPRAHAAPSPRRSSPCARWWRVRSRISATLSAPRSRFPARTRPPAADGGRRSELPQPASSKVRGLTKSPSGSTPSCASTGVQVQG